MLTYLRIRGLALLSDVALELGPGLTVLTGETGAGKSIIAEALLLMRGVRGRPELVRNGEAALCVDAQFELGAAPLRGVQAAGEERGVELGEAAELLAQRVVQRSGRGRCALQGSLVQNAAFAAVGAHLISVCSQHEHHSLVSVAKHLELVDAYADLEDVVEEYAVAWGALREAERAASAAAAEAVQLEQRTALLQHSVEELSALEPKPGEWEDLARHFELQSRAAQYLQYAQEVRERLYDADNCVLSEVSRLLQVANAGMEHSAQLQGIAEALSGVQAACEEAARHASRLENQLEVDPAALSEVEQRIDALASVATKHRVDPVSLPELFERLAAELAGLNSHSERQLALTQRTLELRSRATALAAVLSERRRAACRRMGAELRTELDELCMASASLEAQIVTESALGPRGADRVELHFSANAGEPMAPLSRVASGGELSRVLLAIQGVLSRGDSVATYVFDEVDAGVGGAVAEAIGRRLRRISKERQVLCITHLPQIAVFADAHFRVEKGVEEGRTVTRVVALDEDESVEEVARMLAGARVTQSALEHARELRRTAHAAPLRVVQGTNEPKPAVRRPRRAGSARRACG
jgi:DNA repair protein RecN (Recombination protein N)